MALTGPIQTLGEPSGPESLSQSLPKLWVKPTQILLNVLRHEWLRTDLSSLEVDLRYPNVYQEAANTDIWVSLDDSKGSNNTFPDLKVSLPDQNNPNQA